MLSFDERNAFNNSVYRHRVLSALPTPHPLVGLYAINVYDREKRSSCLPNGTGHRR